MYHLQSAAKAVNHSRDVKERLCSCSYAIMAGDQENSLLECQIFTGVCSFPAVFGVRSVLLHIHSCQERLLNAAMRLRCRMCYMKCETGASLHHGVLIQQNF